MHPILYPVAAFVLGYVVSMAVVALAFTLGVWGWLAYSALFWVAGLVAWLRERGRPPNGMVHDSKLSSERMKAALEEYVEHFKGVKT